MQPSNTTRTRGAGEVDEHEHEHDTTPRAPETRTRTRSKTPPSSHHPTPLSLQGQVPSSGSPSLLLTPTTHTHLTRPRQRLSSSLLSSSIPCRQLNSKQASPCCQPLPALGHDSIAVPRLTSSWIVKHPSTQQRLDCIRGPRDGSHNSARAATLTPRTIPRPDLTGLFFGHHAARSLWHRPWPICLVVKPDTAVPVLCRPPGT